MTEDYLRRQLEQLTGEIRQMRGEQQASAVRLEGRLAKIEAKQAELDKFKDDSMGRTFKAIGVVLSAIVLAVLAAVFPGGVDK